MDGYIICVWATTWLNKMEEAFARIKGIQPMSLVSAAHQDALGPAGRCARQLSHGDYQLSLCCPAAS